MRLVFVGEEADVVRLRKHLDTFAGSDWHMRSDIIPVVVNDRRNPNEVRARLKDVLRPAEDTRIYLLRNDIRFDETGLPRPRAIFQCPGNLEAFLKDELRPALQSIGADWRARVESILSAWDYPDTDETISTDWAEQRIHRWLSQFERLTEVSSRWIGELLLRCFEFVSKADLIGRFKSDVNASSICVMRYDNGKSADIIAGILKKGVMANNGTVHNFNELVRHSPPPSGKVVIFEDGLFSGTEWVGIFRSLLGKRQDAKCAPLANPDAFQSFELEICFAIATTLGIELLQQELNGLGLHHVEIKTSTSIDVLSTHGKQRLADKTLFAGDGKVARDSVLPRVFQDPRWGERRTEAEQLCESVGRDLWRDYWTRKNKPVSDDMLDRVALGASNLGFAMSFSFSMPKVTLPLFWCSGIVQGHTRRFEWKPLFPNAA